MVLFGGLWCTWFHVRSRGVHFCKTCIKRHFWDLALALQNDCLALHCVHRTATGILMYFVDKVSWHKSWGFEVMSHFQKNLRRTMLIGARLQCIPCATRALKPCGFLIFCLSLLPGRLHLQRKNVWVPSSPQDGAVVAASVHVVHVTLRQIRPKVGLMSRQFVLFMPGMRKYHKIDGFNLFFLMLGLLTLAWCRATLLVSGRVL